MHQERPWAQPRTCDGRNTTITCRPRDDEYLDESWCAVKVGEHELVTDFVARYVANNPT